VSQAGFEPEASDKSLRRRPLRVLARPWVERRFLLGDYERLVETLANDSRFDVVPLHEFSRSTRNRVVVGLRHDVDARVESALEMAAVEARHGLRATYFILHTASYYAAALRSGRPRHRESLIPKLRRLQDMGHEIGWHNDLVTLECVLGVDPRNYLATELAWLRENGIEVRGSASHGSYWAHRLGYHNNYFFEDFEEVFEGLPNNEEVEVGERRCRLSKGTLAEFGLEYEAYHLGEDHYHSDARFDDHGNRWHPDRLDLARFEPGEKVIVMTHPEYWDPSVARKALRTAHWSARKLIQGERTWRVR
jgi:hypothetical protein